LSATVELALERLASFQARAESALQARLPAEEATPSKLHAAMRYAALGAGKRIRPVLCYFAGEAVAVAPARLDGPAAAVEMIHAYSLVHDDLPAMDDDALRRGRPTCHKAFGEAAAILAGDALQALAFQLLAHAAMGELSAERRVQMIELLAQAAGSRGMVGGQALDLAAIGTDLDIAQLEDMHIHKTGALIRASVVLGALTAPELGESTLERLDHYAKCIGLAFQIRDDILDVEGETAKLGKRSGADLTLEKSTYPALIGLEALRQRAVELNDEAQDSLSGLGSAADPLRKISLYIIERDR